MRTGAPARDDAATTGGVRETFVVFFVVTFYCRVVDLLDYGSDCCSRGMRVSVRVGIVRGRGVAGGLVSSPIRYGFRLSAFGFRLRSLRVPRFLSAFAI